MKRPGRTRRAWRWLAPLLAVACRPEPAEPEDARAEAVADQSRDVEDEAEADPGRESESGVGDIAPDDGTDDRCERVAERLRSLPMADLLVAEGGRGSLSVPGAHDAGLRLTWSVDAGTVDPSEGWEVTVDAPATRADVHVTVVIEATSCRSTAALLLRVRSAAEVDEMRGCLSETLTWPAGVLPFARVESALIDDRFAVVLCLGPDVRAGTEYLPVSMRVRNVGPDVEGVVEARPSCEFEVRFEGIPPPRNLGICDGLAVECDPPFGTETWSSGATRASGNFYPRFGMDEYSCGVLETFVEGAGDYVASGVYHGRLADGTPLVSDPLAIPFRVLP